MISSFNSFYKQKHGFIKENPSDMSSIDRKLRNMLEKLRMERRQKLLTFQRTEDRDHFKSQGKSNKRSSKFIRDWKLSRTWSRELIEYSWLSMLSEEYKHLQQNPQDWLILPIHKGKRSMLIQGNGYCEIRNKDGWRMFTVRNIPFAHSGLTIIDGIFNQDQNTFYCNDLIVWNNLNLCIATTECRLHFLTCRISETEVISKALEDVDICMELESGLKIIPKIRIKLVKYLPLSKENLLNLFGVNSNSSDNLQSNYKYLVFVRKDSSYDTEQYCDESNSQCQEYCTIPQPNWLLWRDKKTNQFSKDVEIESRTNSLTFKLNINEKNELYTKDKVLIGKVKFSGKVSESLSLDNDQKKLKNEFGVVFVNVKFEEKNILKFLDLIVSRYSINSWDDKYKESKDIVFEFSNVSSQDKFSSKLDCLDKIFFKCIEFITETKRNNFMLVDEFNLNLNMEYLLNSMFN